jgi:hypothetical protein
VGERADADYVHARQRVVTQRLEADAAGNFDESRAAAIDAASDWETAADRAAQAAERREAVMARGTRLDESVPGSGLGLAIVQEIAVRHGGEVTVSDARPRAASSGGSPGALFTVRLRVQPQGNEGGGPAEPDRAI